MSIVLCRQAWKNNEEHRLYDIYLAFTRGLETFYGQIEVGDAFLAKFFISFWLDIMTGSKLAWYLSRVHTLR